jgi:hypothetical protein
MNKRRAERAAGRDPELQARINVRQKARETERGAAQQKQKDMKAKRRSDTMGVIKAKTVGAARSAGKFGISKLKQKWKGAASKVHGGIAGAKERVSKAIGVEGGTATASRGRADAAAAASKKAGKSAAAHKGNFKRNLLRGGVKKDPTALTGGQTRELKSRGKTLAGIKAGMASGERPRPKQVKHPVLSSHNWEADLGYEMLRLFENTH